ncbi:hypothetical protein CYMTET_37382 [Cymbomonas tetramitiformis]|uniref:Uncharacterized protein n=1 Tax=Cymbomonas tetramitiformis TaxID=36881 RepID=A0AAE0CFE0_9CHLO|nr:hypothetical protein CYMTET_37382 [Cymbomonas tetramitiformis]
MAIQMNAARRDVTATTACDGKNSKSSQASDEQYRQLFPNDTQLGERSYGGLLCDTGRKVQHLLDSLFFYWFDFDDVQSNVDAHIPRLGCVTGATIWACAWRDFDRLRNLHPTFEGQRRAAIRGILWLCAGDKMHESHKDTTDAILHELFDSIRAGDASANTGTNVNEGVMTTISNLMLHVITTSSATSLKAGDRSSGSSGSSCPFSPSSSSKPVAYVRDTLLGMYVWGCGFDRILADEIYAIMGYKAFANRWDGTSLPYIAPSNYWNIRERNSANQHWRGWRADIKAAFSERRDRCRRYARNYNFGLAIVSRFIQVTHLLWGHPEHHDVPLQFWLHYWKYRDNPDVVTEMRSALDSHRAHLGHICTHLDAAADFESPPMDLVEAILKEIMHVAIVCRRRPEYADLATDGLCAIFESSPLCWYRSPNNAETEGNAAMDCMEDEIENRNEFNSDTFDRFHMVIDAMRRSGHLKEARELFRRVESAENNTDHHDWSERCGSAVGPCAGRFSASPRASAPAPSPQTSSEILRGMPLQRHPPRSHILNMTHSAWAMWRKWLPPDIADMPTERVDIFRVDEFGSVYVEMGCFGMSAITTMTDLLYTPRSRSTSRLDTVVEGLAECEGRFLKRCRQMLADVDSSRVKTDRATRTIARMRTGVLSHLVHSVWGESAFGDGRKDAISTGVDECILRYLDSLHTAPGWKRYAWDDDHRSRERTVWELKKRNSKKRKRRSLGGVEEKNAGFAGREDDSMHALTTGLLHLYLCVICAVPPMGISIGDTRSLLGARESETGTIAEDGVPRLAQFATPEFLTWLRARAESVSNPPRLRYLSAEVAKRWDDDAATSANSPYTLAIQKFIRMFFVTPSQKVAESLADARLNGDADKAVPNVGADGGDARFPIFTHPLYAFVNTRSCADHPLWTPYTEVFEAIACDEEDRELSRVLL